MMMRFLSPAGRSVFGWVVVGAACWTSPAGAQLFEGNLGRALGAAAESAVDRALSQGGAVTGRRVVAGNSRSTARSGMSAEQWIGAGVGLLNVLADADRGSHYHTEYCDGRPVDQRKPCPPPVAGSPLERHFEQARQALRSRSYVVAMKHADLALQESPENSDVQQLRSLIFFSQGRYREAAGAAYQALANGPGWNWNTIWQMMGSKEHYEQGYQALFEAAENNPESVDFHFLLGYHHLMLGHLEEGRNELRTVQQLLPEDPLNNNLLASLPAKGGAAER